MAEYTDFLKVKGYMTKQKYPKPPAPMVSGEYSIIKICITEVLEGELHPRAKNKANEVSIKGNLPLIEPYEDMEFTLELDEVHETYGASYNIRFSKTIYEFKKPSDLRIFLSKILTETQVKNLFDKYPNPLEIFQNNDIDKLIEVKGIGETVAEKIMQKYMSTLDYAEVYVELDGMGVTPKMIKKLVDEFGSPDIVVQRVKSNPYILTELDGIGFKKADIIAMRLGIPEDSVDRLEAFIVYTLTEWAEDGYSWVSSGALVDAIENNLYDYEMDVIADVVKSLKEREILHDSDFGVIALKKYYNLEKSIAQELARIKRGCDEQDRYNGWEDRIAIAEKMNGWEYTAEQKKAIEDVISESVLVISGKAGSGKTSTVLGGLKALGNNIIFAQCSLSGKAAARMTESTGYEAYTIHRLLGFNPTSENENKSPFFHNENNPLPHDVIIVDEFPMIGGSLFLSLIKAVPTGAKLILLGDPAQLSSIGSLNIGSDIINSGFIKVAMLTKIHRQASKSAIITDSLQISEGIEFLDKDFTGIEIRGELQDFEVDIYDNKMSTVGKILKHFKKKLELSGNDIMEVQVIVPLNSRGEASVARLNPLLQDIYNPYSDDKKQIEAKFSKDDTTIFRVGDKVMNIKNNYKLMEYIDVNEFDYDDIFSFDSPTENTTKPVQVFNGYLGTLIDIKENNDLIIYFPLVDKNVVVPMSHWHKKRGIVLGYAAGVHKSQGSGFKYPIVGIDYSHYVMLSRQLVYTAITRAIKHCVLIAERKALQYAISQSAIEYKQTFLKEMLNNLQINKESSNESN